MKILKNSRLNAIDTALILVLLFLVISAYMNTNSKRIEMLNIKSQDASITVNVTDEYAGFLKNAKIGQKLILAGSDICIGKITAIDKVYKEIPVINQDGQTSYKVHDSIYGYKITLETTVKKNVNGYYIEGALFAAPGKKLLVNLFDIHDNFYVEIDSLNIK